MTKLAKALTVVFILFLVALLAELSYVLWRRRSFRRRIQNPPTLHGAALPTDSHSQTSPDRSSTFASFSSSSSKELLYFFCLNSTEISQIERKPAPPSLNSNVSAPSDEVEDIDVFKLQNMYGPSKVLFTIKEGEKEGADLESDKSVCSSAEKGTEKQSKRINLEECFKLKLDEDNLPEVKIEVGDDNDPINLGGENEMTPFSTPCDSPMYFTPTASPIREVDISEKRSNGHPDEQMRSSTLMEVEV